MESNVNKTIGNNIKLFRNKSGVTQDEFSAYLNIKRETLSYYETGQRAIPTDIITKAANLFGLDEYELFNDDLAGKEFQLAFAFRSELLDAEAMAHIAAFKKIALNYMQMSKKIKYGIPSTGKESK